MLGALPGRVSGLEREAFPRAPAARPWLPVGLHLGQDAAAHGGPGGACGAARGASSQARAQAVRRHDAAPGRLARGLACGRGRQLDLIVTMDDATSTIYSAFLVEEEGTASTFRGAAGSVHRAGLAVEPLHRSRQPLFLHPAGGRGGRQGPADPGRPRARAARNRAYRGLFAGSARALGAHVRHAAGSADQGTERRPASPTSMPPIVSSARSICRRTMRVLPEPPQIAGERVRGRPDPRNPRRHPVHRGGARGGTRQHRRL